MSQTVIERLKEQVAVILNQSLRLLILDDQQPVRETLQRHMSAIPFYQISVCATQREALALFESNGPFHVCLYDLSVTDIDNDPFYLLKRFYNQTSFIVVTGSRSPIDGGICRDLGAREILEKTTLTKSQTQQVVNKWALINIVLPEFDMRNDSVLSRAVKILIDDTPENVGEWVRKLDIDDSAFRKTWGLRNIQPKQVLEIYSLFSIAMRLYEDGSDITPCQEQSLQSRLEYFLTHRSKLLASIQKSFSKPAFR